jgi:hypothetical protein
MEHCITEPMGLFACMTEALLLSLTSVLSDRHAQCKVGSFAQVAIDSNA